MPGPNHHTKPDYSHLFDTSEDGTDRGGKPQDAAPRPALRIGAIITGLMFCMLPMIFIAGGIGIAAWTTYSYLAWPTAQAKIVTLEETEPQGDSNEPGIEVEYRFDVDGRDYSGDFSMTGNTVGIDKIRSLRPGQDIEIHYPPDDPGDSRRRQEPAIMMLGFTLFAVPFLAIGWTSLITGIRGDANPQKNQDNKADKSADRKPQAIAFFILCCLGAFAYMILAAFLFSWWIDLILFIGYVGFVIPASMKKFRAYALKHQAKQQAEQAGEKEEFNRQFVSDDGLAGPGHEGSAADGLISPQPAFRPEDTPNLPSPQKQFLKSALITLFVCGLVGTFVGVAGYPMLKSKQASSFKQTTGIVLRSRVKSSSDADSSTTYAPVIEYRYTLDGKDYVNDDYEFMTFATSDHAYARKIVDRHPAGKAVTVYYNPNDPQDAVLYRDVSSSNWFVLLFLQPFVMIALGLLIYLPFVPLRNRQLRNFLFSPTLLPQPIPFWGTLRNGINGMTIKKTGRLMTFLYTVLIGYGLTAFVSIFIGAFIIGVSNFKIDHLKTIAIAGLVVGGVFGFITLLKRYATVTLDFTTRQLCVISGRRNVQIHFKEIAYWQIRVFSMSTPSQKTKPQVSYLLEAIGRDRENTVPVHYFTFNTSALASEDMRRCVVRRAMHTLAEITESVVQPRIVIEKSPWNDLAQSPHNITDVISSIRKSKSEASQYNDLS